MSSACFFCLDNVFDVLTISSYFTVWLSSGVAMWEVQRCDRMWGTFSSAKSLKRSFKCLNSASALLTANTCLPPGGFWLQKHCDGRETDFLLRANPWRKSLGERDILIWSRFCVEMLLKQDFVVYSLPHPNLCWSVFEHYSLVFP